MSHDSGLFRALSEEAQHMLDLFGMPRLDEAWVGVGSTLPGTTEHLAWQGQLLRGAGRQEMQAPLFVYCPDEMAGDSLYHGTHPLCGCGTRRLWVPMASRDTLLEASVQQSFTLRDGGQLEIGPWGGPRHSAFVRLERRGDVLLQIQWPHYEAGWDPEHLEPRKRLTLRQATSRWVDDLQGGLVSINLVGTQVPIYTATSNLDGTVTIVLDGGVKAHHGAPSDRHDCFNI